MGRPIYETDRELTIMIMRYLKYLFYIALLTASQITSALGVYNECICKDCGNSFGFKDFLYGQRIERCPFCGSNNWEIQN